MSELQDNIAGALQKYLNAGFSGWGAWLKAFVEDREAGVRGMPVHDLLEKLQAMKGGDADIAIEFAPLLTDFRNGVHTPEEMAKNAGAVGSRVIETSQALQRMLVEIDALLEAVKLADVAGSKATKEDEFRSVTPVSPVPAATSLPQTSPVVTEPQPARVVVTRPAAAKKSAPSSEDEAVLAAIRAGHVDFSVFTAMKPSAVAPAKPTVYRRSRRLRRLAPSLSEVGSTVAKTADERAATAIATAADQLNLGGRGKKDDPVRRAAEEMQAKVRARTAAQVAALRGGKSREADSSDDEAEYGDFSGLRCGV
ncbi:MAG: hypothetical protein P1U63_09920 [Coxiellaceae bacterium]|nr:hypothetical protein [Coxiellaceae bacterium]